MSKDLPKARPVKPESKKSRIGPFIVKKTGCWNLNIPKIKTPTFIIQAKNDPVVNPSSAYEIYEKIKSEKKELLMLDLDNHIIIKGENTKELFEEIHSFLDTLEKED